MYKLSSVVWNQDQITSCYFELQKLEQIMFAAQAKKVSPTLPQLSEELASILKNNRMDLSTSSLRSLREWLDLVKKRALVINLVFNTTLTDKHRIELINWFRDKINPDCLFKISQRSSIGGGFILQTPTNWYDFTFKKIILNQPLSIIDKA